MKLPLFKSRPHSFPIIAVEGPNGVGKTTLCHLIADHHKEIVSGLCMPEEYRTATQIRRIIREDRHLLASDLFFLSGMVIKKNLINEYFRKHHHCSAYLSDRSIWSTYAATYAISPSSIGVLTNLIRVIETEIYIPDLTILLTADYETCKQRISHKLSGKEFDDDSFSMFCKKLCFFSTLQANDYQVLSIDTNCLTANQVYETAYPILKEFISQYHIKN